MTCAIRLWHGTLIAQHCAVPLNRLLALVLCAHTDPDKQADDVAAEAAVEKFKRVQRAHAVLSDRPRRQAYNELITQAWRVETGIFE